MNQECQHPSSKEIMPGFFKCRICNRIFTNNDMKVAINFNPEFGNPELKLVASAGYAGAILSKQPDILIDTGYKGISPREFKTQIVASGKFSDQHKTDIINGLSNIIEL
jgi:hypothetical protein